MSSRRGRRTRDASRQVIIEAAEVLFMQEGLDGVRVQRIAATIGITDAAIHYHFGNRQGLVEELLRHSARRLVEEIAVASDVAGSGELDLPAISQALTEAYGDQGGARLAVWLMQAGWQPRGSGMLAALVERMHSLHVAAARSKGRPEPSLDEAKFLVAQLNAIHIAQAILGEPLLRAVGAEADAAGQRRFLEWATAMVMKEVGLE